MRASPDGYTLYFATNSPLAAVPAMRKTPPYDPVADFAPIGFVGRYLHAVLVHPDVPVKTLGEFFTYARANPGKLNYGSGGTFQIISTANLMKSAGISMVHVPYKGEPAALVDLIAGRLQFIVATQSTSLPFVKDGKLRALAITNSTRSPAWPDVPTLTESGIKTFPTLSWAVMVGPAKMPANVVDRHQSRFERGARQAGRAGSPRAGCIRTDRRHAGRAQDFHSRTAGVVGPYRSRAWSPDRIANANSQSSDVDRARRSHASAMQ